MSEYNRAVDVDRDIAIYAMHVTLRSAGSPSRCSPFVTVSISRVVR